MSDQVTIEHAIACYGPDLVAEIITYRRHRDDEFGQTYWVLDDLEDLAETIIVQMREGRHP